jgi:hypothetical protein
MRKAVVVLAALASALALAGGAAHASPRLQVGVVEHAMAYYEDPARFYPLLGRLHPQLLRVNLNWGGALGVARRRPLDGADPLDRAYDWSLYDRIVLDARAVGVDVVFSVFGTPPWANGGRPPNRAPTNAERLEEFAYAAATRYSGLFRRRDGVVLPPVEQWIAWNEPNLRLGLVPQWLRVDGRWTIRSAVDYARICDAIADGVHETMLAGERVACGVTAPRGNNNPRGLKPSVSPLAFMRAMAAAGASGFDAYAHQPYYGSPGETPTTEPRGRYAVTFARLDTLVAEVTKLWGPIPIWLTEYGYQTNPPDREFGVSYARQARYLRQAFAIAYANPRVDMIMNFLLRDEPRVEKGWQSGLVTAAGKLKPAFAAFRDWVADLRCAEGEAHCSP